MQRVPKKPNEVKVDLQNSTAYSLRSLRVTVVGRIIYTEILRLQRLTPFSLRMTKWEDCLSISVNYLKSLLYLRLWNLEGSATGMNNRNGWCTPGG